MLKKPQHIQFRFSQSGYDSLKELSELVGENVSTICRDFLCEGMRLQMEYDEHFPVAFAQLNAAKGEQIIDLYISWTKCKTRKYPGYSYDIIEELDTNRILIKSPANKIVRNRTKDYEQNQIKTLVEKGKFTEKKAKEIVKVLQKSRGQEVPIK